MEKELKEAFDLLFTDPSKSKELALKIIESHPQDWWGWLVLGKAHAWLKEWAESELAYRKVLELSDEPKALANAFIGYAELYECHGAFDKAIEFANEALKLKPHNVAIETILANAYRFAGKPHEAEFLYKKLIKAKPDYAEALLGLGILYLSQGKWKRGWELYKHRWRLKKIYLSPPPDSGKKLWSGESLENRTLLIWGDQGFGDIIWALRYVVRFFKEYPNTKVIFRVPPSMKELIEYNFKGLCAVIHYFEDIPEHDYHVSLMDLPGKNVIPSIKLEVPKDRKIILPDDNLKVGYVWMGNPKFPYNACRSIHPDDWEDLISTPGITFVKLQQGFSDYPLADFMETAGIVSSLDLVIGVDTGVMHLAGALDIPNWWIFGPALDWRWHHQGWYPKMRSWQNKQGTHEGASWRNVLMDVKRDLCVERDARRAQYSGEPLEA